MWEESDRSSQQGRLSFAVAYIRADFFCSSPLLGNDRVDGMQFDCSALAPVGLNTIAPANQKEHGKQAVEKRGRKKEWEDRNFQRQSLDDNVISSRSTFPFQRTWPSLVFAL